MKFIQYLQEEYLTTMPLHTGRKGLEIYIDPTKSDLIRIYKGRIKQLRFIADPKYKKLFVFDAGMALHSWVENHLVKTDNLKNKDVVCGFCNIDGGRLVGVGTAYFTGTDIEDFINNIEWFTKFIPTKFDIVGFGNIIFKD